MFDGFVFHPSSANMKPHDLPWLLLIDALLIAVSALSNNLEYKNYHLQQHIAE